MWLISSSDGRDQAGQADGLRAVFPGRVQDLVGRDHDAQVDDLVAVAAEHHADDVLADVVHVALDRGDDDRPLEVAAGALLFLLDVGHQVGHGLLHHARRFHHLRQEHLALRRTGRRPRSCRPSAGLRSRAAAAPAASAARHSSVSATMKSVMPLHQRVARGACPPATAPGQVDHLVLGAPFTRFGDSISAFAGTGRRFSTTSSTRSRSSGARSSYTPTMPALTMPMSSPA
jgi:hypothetical protein